MLQKQRKAGEPTTPSPFAGGGTAAKAALAAKMGRAAIDKLDNAREQALEREMEQRRARSRQGYCSCG